MKQPLEESLYHRLGGEKTLQQLVEVFYDKVARHPDLAPIFPDDFTLTKEKQFKFLSQFFGGPDLYNQAYGHPMLRARHLRFPITPTRARAWLACMQETLDELGLEDHIKQEMMMRLTYTAQHMINTPEQEN
ncbi:hemoglobin [Caldalkalibacillus uzonensis]|uniref:Hemoglobin n=1 Tax=Caldalkalibacillus uzonensis TaxID=353224 RepID=A0ABU0CTJ5_9BACI|nr:globin [Caldalkalibacillus uzonensis]MDQ0339741.1 hemoglobin [Caldalkalibacillus uzonensis]